MKSHPIAEPVQRALAHLDRDDFPREEEFPDLSRSICQGKYLFVHNRSNKVAAHANGCDVRDHAEAFEICVRTLRAERARHSIAANHSALMDAECGPERTVR